jgi:hypothetical protein
MKQIANLHSAQLVRQHKFDTSKKRSNVGYIAAELVYYSILP